MESLLSYLFGLRKAVRLFSAVRCNRPFRKVQSFSTWEKPPLSEVGNQEIACSRVSQQAETADCKKTSQLGCQPLRIFKNPKDPTRWSKSWRKLRTKAAPSRQEEFRSLRNDDFPELKMRPQQKLLAVEKPKGLDILFGIAPCSLALARSKRDISRLFLKSSRSGQSPVLEEFAQLAKSRRIPVQLVQRKVLDALCKGGVHQGVCLEATPLHPIGWQERLAPEGEGAAAHQESQLIWLALEGIQDPMNLGAVLRSAHFLGVDGIVMSQRNRNNERVVGFVVAGNEGYGLSPETRGICQRMLTISPGRELPAGIESLNVSVAAGNEVYPFSHSFTEELFCTLYAAKRSKSCEASVSTKKQTNNAFEEVVLIICDWNDSSIFGRRRTL
ncbi:hypothetical protein lerEdw1_001825 [Lerista edwardsae]|nr:hypothetical protein lerEdw1_001825 [Lerista edwardsae]